MSTLREEEMNHCRYFDRLTIATFGFVLPTPYRLDRGSNEERVSRHRPDIFHESIYSYQYREGNRKIAAALHRTRIRRIYLVKESLGLCNFFHQIR